MSSVQLHLCVYYYVRLCHNDNKKIRHAEPMLAHCWPSVCDAGSTLCQRWFSISRLPHVWQHWATFEPAVCVSCGVRSGEQYNVPEVLYNIVKGNKLWRHWHFKPQVTSHCCCNLKLYFRDADVWSRSPHWKKKMFIFVFCIVFLTNRCVRLKQWHSNDCTLTLASSPCDKVL